MKFLELLSCFVEIALKFFHANGIKRGDYCLTVVKPPPTAMFYANMLGWAIYCSSLFKPESSFRGPSLTKCKSRSNLGNVVVFPN